jgi:hypothetical protein
MSERITKERIVKRIAELKQAEQKSRIELSAICTAIAELQALLTPEPIITEGEQEA